ncbi:MAG: tetratricopeptide repeat protein [Acidobacteria bacterium]|nr:tetratricopeptide repeat protein [Acidobacteriota bacterium]
MRHIQRQILRLAAVTVALSVPTFSQQIQRTPFDVTNYQIDAQLSPAENKLTATADVSFVPLEDTRSVSFELNGSLKVDSITRLDASTGTGPAKTTTSKIKPPVTAVTGATTPPGGITFVQDQVGVTDLGPSVRIDLGDTVTKGTPLKLRFKYSGVLNTPSGGPLLTKRLAYIGDDQGYLMYAARWFPFHDYAADPASSDISITAPAGLQVVGFSDTPVTSAGGKFRFTQAKPGLIGNIAYGKFVNRNLRIGDYEVQFYTRPGNDNLVASYGETLGKALGFYNQKFGSPDMGKKLIVAQIDDESLEFYSSLGMLFMSNRQFEQDRPITTERLQREAALQWWGQTVGLKSFDDAWLSQGLAEYSAFSLRESTLNQPQAEGLRRELLEKSLTFEQTASLLRAPANLDDQSIAYQYIMYAKGAFVYKLLRDTLGAQKFDKLLRTFLQEYRGKNASIEDFEKLTTKIADENMRYFFARWVEGTGVPEFSSDYLIIRTKGGKFVARGTIKQNYDNLRLPVDIQLRSEGEGGLKTVTVQVDEATADFNIESEGKPLSVVIDPSYKLLRISPDLRVSSIARRGIEQFKEGNYVEAQAQFEAALKLDRSNSWIYYHLGLLFLEQRNYDLAIDNFKATLSGDLSPTWLQVWAEIKMGNAYDAKGDRNRASSAYGRAEKLNDNYDNAQEAVRKYQATPYDPREAKATAVK